MNHLPDSKLQPPGQLELFFVMSRDSEYHPIGILIHCQRRDQDRDLFQGHWIQRNPTRSNPGNRCLLPIFITSLVGLEIL